jgi:hypothetical protein
MKVAAVAFLDLAFESAMIDSLVRGVPDVRRWPAKLDGALSGKRSSTDD